MNSRPHLLGILLTVWLVGACAAPGAAQSPTEAKKLLESSGNKPSETVDPDACWATDVKQYPGETWWRVDLEKPTTVGRVVVVGYYGDRRFYGFTVETSLDGKEWEMVADRHDNQEPSTAKGYVCRFEPRQVRFIRVTQTHNSANPGRHLVEVMAFEH